MNINFTCAQTFTYNLQNPKLTNIKKPPFIQKMKTIHIKVRHDYYTTNKHTFLSIEVCAKKIFKESSVQSLPAFQTKKKRECFLDHESNVQPHFLGHL